MKKVSAILTLLLAAAISWPAATFAQDYDDLYYSPSKAAEKKKKQEEARRAAMIQQQTADYTTILPSADTYTGGSDKPLQVDVDTYNRRNTSAASTSTASAGLDDGFSYTRRIERFHNPEVVEASGDQELMEYYYSAQEAQPLDVDVYIINNSNPFWSSPAWSLYSPFYNPYYYGYYSSWRPGWGWSMSWGFDPWFDLSFGWNSPWYNPWYGPGWGPSWGWGGGWGGPRPPHPGGVRPPSPSHGWASNSAGASRPHRQPSHSAGVSTSRHPSGGNRWDYTRPGNISRPGNSASSSQPSWNTRPATNGSHNSSVNSSAGSRRSTGNVPSNRNNNSNYRNSSSGSHNSTPSYRSSGSTGRSGGSSFGGGSRSTGGGGAGRSRR